MPHRDLLLIFTRNPELGKCKTRLAAKVGNQAALDIYVFLLEHTARITEGLNFQKRVYYSEDIWENDIWDDRLYEKKLQQGADLGERMAHAFAQGFMDGYHRICIIGSDMFHLSSEDISTAFSMLHTHDVVLGPATDGGYYLLGMKKLKDAPFINKAWCTHTVLRDTLADLSSEKVYLLPEKNDVDHYEDIKDIPEFGPFLKHMKE
ncbi:MAG: TIGR04282 family arsenosugar biosynthesis glycosyltransferase [Flavobacteriaceae bacterium]